MYKVERRPSGYILTFGGSMDAAEMTRWLNESKIALNAEKESSFGVIIDMRNAMPFDPETSAVLKDGQKLYKAKGMNRSCVIVNSAELSMQLKNVAVQTGIYSKERYVDASSDSDAIGKAIAWVKDQKDPDK